MLYESTTLLLRSIVDSLESGDETKWDDHLEFGYQCIYELFQMCRPERRKYNGYVATVFERASRAIPHVKQMNRAIRQRDRATAIECGRAAVLKMNGTEQRISSVVAPNGNTAVARQPEGVAPKIVRRKKLTVERAAVPRQRSARASIAN
jgi:hypothetical protein